MIPMLYISYLLTYYPVSTRNHASFIRKVGMPIV